MNSLANKVSWSDRKGVVFAFLLTFLFAVLFYHRVTSPWIWGYDPVHRLTKIDDTIVILLGNPWLPVVQMIMQVVHLFTDAPQAYKAVNFIIACGGLFMFSLIGYHFLGLVPALISTLYFFLHIQWSGAASSVYLEPSAFFFITWSLFFYLKGRKLLFSLFYIIATFCRPEFLLAAPGFALGHLYLFRDWKRTFRFCLLFLPILIYYILIKIYLPSFDTPMSFRWQESIQLAGKLTDVFRTRWEFMLLGVLGLGGVYATLFHKDFLPKIRRVLIAGLIGGLIFYLTFVFILPLAHDFSPGGTRQAMYLAIPVSIFCGVFSKYLIEHGGRLASIPLIAVFALLILYRVQARSFEAPWSYKTAEKIDRQLLDEGFNRGVLRFCILDRAKGGRPVFGVHRDAVLLHLRFMGWSSSSIDCTSGAKEWQQLASLKQVPVLRFYRKPMVEPEYLDLITAECKHHELIKIRRKIVGDVCY